LQNKYKRKDPYQNGKGLFINYM